MDIDTILQYRDMLRNIAHLATYHGKRIEHAVHVMQDTYNEDLQELLAKECWKHFRDMSLVLSNNAEFLKREVHPDKSQE